MLKFILKNNSNLDQHNFKVMVLPYSALLRELQGKSYELKIIKLLFPLSSNIHNLCFLMYNFMAF